VCSVPPNKYFVIPEAAKHVVKKRQRFWGKTRVDDGDLKIPVSVVVRNPRENRVGESYVLAKDKKYIVGLRQSTEGYLELVQKFASILNDGQIKSIRAAKAKFRDEVGL